MHPHTFIHQTLLAFSCVLLLPSSHPPAPFPHPLTKVKRKGLCQLCQPGRVQPPFVTNCKLYVLLCASLVGGINAVNYSEPTFYFFWVLLVSCEFTCKHDSSRGCLSVFCLTVAAKFSSKPQFSHLPTKAGSPCPPERDMALWKVQGILPVTLSNTWTLCPSVWLSKLTFCFPEFSLYAAVT